MVDLLERLSVMKGQESGVYRTEDYLAPERQRELASLVNSDSHLPFSSGSSDSSCSSSSSAGINEVWREKICEWSYQVIDHFDFSREVVSVSIHYLDRYLASRTVNKKVFQLAAMTCLFLAIKLYEPGRLSMSSMIELSRGYFKVDQMAAMELNIFRTLSWRVHPPTAYCFSKHILFLLPYSSVPMDVRHDTLELARFLTELSVIDYFFVVHKPSTVGMASLVNAMQDIPGAQAALPEFVKEVKRIIDVDADGAAVQECCNRLRLLYEQGGYARPTTSRSETRAETVSPVCVSDFTNHQPSTQQAFFCAK